MALVNCFPESLEASENRRRELQDQGVENASAVFRSEVESGKIPMPDFAVRCTLRAHSAAAGLPLTVIHIPGATADSLDGISTAPSSFRPWLMDAGASVSISYSSTSRLFCTESTPKVCRAMCSACRFSTSEKTVPANVTRRWSTIMWRGAAILTCGLSTLP